jgi:transposase
MLLGRPAVYADRIKRELVKRGATLGQASEYVATCKRYERLSKGNGALHHALPKHCGWWKQYQHNKWNLVKIDWALHVALHAYLCFIFPKNSSLSRALGMTASSRRLDSPKKRRHQADVIARYANGETLAQIANSLRVSPTAIKGWILAGGGKMRTNAEAKTRLQRENYEERVVGWYQNGDSVTRIGKRLKISPWVIRRWLLSWGIKPRNWSQQARFKREPHKVEVIRRYLGGEKQADIGRSFGVNACAIHTWLRVWGVKKMSCSERTKRAWKSRRAQASR